MAYTEREIKMKKGISALLAATMCVSLVACGGTKTTDTSAESASTTASASTTTEASASTESTTAAASSLRVAWWGGQERHNATIEALDAYAADQGTEFVYEYNSWSSYFENLATQAVGSNLPDIIQMSTTDIINYSKNGQIIDLQQYIDDGTIDTTYIEKDSLSGGKVNGQLAGITTGVNTVSVVYNQEVFDQAGVAYPADDWTWSDFIDTAKTIYEKTGIQTEIPFLSEARWVVEAMVRCYGYDFFSEDGESLPWSEDEQVITSVENAIQQVYDGVQAGYFVDPEVQVAWATTEDTYIAKGNAAMSFLLSNYYSTYAKALNTATGQTLMLTMLPKMDDAKQSGMYLNSNMYWCISSNCKDPAAAAAVINYLLNDQAACKIIGTDRGISLSSDIRDMLSSSEDTDVYTKNTLDYVSRVSAVVESTNPADPINSAEVISALKTDYQAVMYGEMTPEDCIADFINQAASILPQ